MQTSDVLVQKMDGTFMRYTWVRIPTPQLTNSASWGKFLMFSEALL